MMNKVLLFVLFGIMFCSLSVSGQVWKLHLNTNQAFILGNKLKGQYPALWHDKNDGLLVGGFGLGTSYTEDYKHKYRLKYQVNLIRQRYYDVPNLVTDASGALVYGSLGINTNCNIIGNFTINHSLGLYDKWL